MIRALCEVKENNLHRNHQKVFLRSLKHFSFDEKIVCKFGIVK